MKTLSPKIDCVVDARCEIAEVPLWDERAQVLWWTNIHGPALNRYDPATGRNTEYAMPAPLGSFALREKGGVLVALKTGLGLFDPATGALDFLINPEPHFADHRLNEGKCDRAGAFWVGSMKDPIEPFRADSAFYRFSPARKLTRKIEGVITANGVAFSPDNRIMYRSDSHPSIRTVFAYDHDPADGAIANERVFVDTHGMEGRPDGCCMDAEGCYWMAAIGSWSLLRFTPKGKLDMTVKLPFAWPTMPAFGGGDFRTLYVTSIRRKNVDVADQPQAGGVFATAVPGVQGLPEPRFGG